MNPMETEQDVGPHSPVVTEQHAARDDGNYCSCTMALLHVKHGAKLIDLVLDIHGWKPAFVAAVCHSNECALALQRSLNARKIPAWDALVYENLCVARREEVFQSFLSEHYAYHRSGVRCVIATMNCHLVVAGQT